VRGYGRHEPACRRRHEPDMPIPIIDGDEGDAGGFLFRQGEGGKSDINLGHHSFVSNLRIADDSIETNEVVKDPSPVEDVQGSDNEPDGTGSDNGKCRLDTQFKRLAYLMDIIAPGSNAQTPQDGDIVIQYHPHSEKATRVISPEDFKESLNCHPDTTGTLDELWCPFSSREDFEFAEFVHDVKLSQKQIEALIKLIQRCQEGPTPFTMNTFSDIKQAMDDADKLLTNVIATT
jgi:hypothetical protein